MSSDANRQVLLARHPDGAPKPDDFELRDGQVSYPDEGQILVRNSYLSLDPYMRGLMKGDRDADFAAKLKAVVPDGVDIYFENVGGAVFDAVWPLLNIHARVPVCGLVAGYNGAKKGADHDRLPDLAFTLITKRITMKGFMSGDHVDRLGAFTAEMRRGSPTAKSRRARTSAKAWPVRPRHLSGCWRARTSARPSSGCDGTRRS